MGNIPRGQTASKIHYLCHSRNNAEHLLNIFRFLTVCWIKRDSFVVSYASSILREHISIEKWILNQTHDERTESSFFSPLPKQEL